MAVGTCTFALGKDCALWLKLSWLCYNIRQVGVNAMAGTIDIRLGGGVEQWQVYHYGNPKVSN